MLKERLNTKKVSVIVIIFLILLVGVFSYFGYQNFVSVSQNTTYLENKVAELQEENNTIINALREEQKKNSEFSEQIGQILGTVGRLDQLSKTDKELLQKYSKIYFLNENYIPENLTEIPSDYINTKGKVVKMHTKAFPYLQEMIVAAKKDGIDLKIISGFRSFGEQSALKNTYAVTYGSGANKFSADQGFSEHQLGTALDFTTAELGLGYTGFKKSEAYIWLMQNAYKYGFVISYPEGNKYYMFEPWHWRFVGKALANRLHQEGENFYDVDQRVINNYLIKIFD